MRNKTFNMDLLNFCHEHNIRVTTYCRNFTPIWDWKTTYCIPYKTEFSKGNIIISVPQRKCLKPGNRLIVELMNVFNIKEVTKNDSAQ